jgi:large subunit ribosomal protein L33
MAKKNKITTHMACEGCKERNYTQVIAKRRMAGALALSKFCSRCRKHTLHKETK